jgi:hypothetical protein
MVEPKRDDLAGGLVGTEVVAIGSEFEMRSSQTSSTIVAVPIDGRPATVSVTDGTADAGSGLADDGFGPFEA